MDRWSTKANAVKDSIKAQWPALLCLQDERSTSPSCDVLTAHTLLSGALPVTGCIQPTWGLPLKFQQHGKEVAKPMVVSEAREPERSSSMRYLPPPWWHSGRWRALPCARSPRPPRWRIPWALPGPVGTPHQCQPLGTLREQPTLTGGAAWAPEDEQDILSQLPHTSSQTLPSKPTGPVTLVCNPNCSGYTGVQSRLVWVTLGMGWTKTKGGLDYLQSPWTRAGIKSALPNLKISIPSYTGKIFAAYKALGNNHFWSLLFCAEMNFWIPGESKQKMQRRSEDTLERLHTLITAWRYFPL